MTASLAYCHMIFSFAVMLQEEPKIANSKKSSYELGKLPFPTGFILWFCEGKAGCCGRQSCLSTVRSKMHPKPSSVMLFLSSSAKPLPCNIDIIFSWPSFFLLIVMAELIKIASSGAKPWNEPENEPSWTRGYWNTPRFRSSPIRFKCNLWTAEVYLLGNYLLIWELRN